MFSSSSSGWSVPVTKLPYEVNFWGILPYCPHIPVEILPCKPTVAHLKNAIVYLEKKCGEKIPIIRSDGRKLPPRKCDYLDALLDFVPAPFPQEVLMTVLSYAYFAPTSFCLLSKHITSLVNTEEFFFKVCTNAGYGDIKPLSYRQFFMDNVDISGIWRQAICCKYEDALTTICIIDMEKKSVDIIRASTLCITKGQARNIAMNLRRRPHRVAVPDNPGELAIPVKGKAMIELALAK